MKPIEDLKREHGAVKITLRVLDSICRESEKTNALANPDHVEQLIEFFATFVDRCHHGKEEELLFPALEEVGVSREGGPIGVMLKEHQQGRDHVANMKAALIGYRDGDRGAAGDFVHHARATITLLNQHIEKEKTCRCLEGVFLPVEIVVAVECGKRADEQNREQKQGCYRVETKAQGKCPEPGP